MAGDASGNPMADDVYQPTEALTRDDPEDIDLDNALDQKQQDEMLDEGYSPPEKPLAVRGPGTTAREQHDRESLDERLAAEVPEVAVPEGNGIGDQPGMEGEPLADHLSGEDRAGRIVQDDAGTRRGSDVIARDVGIDGGAASAEEAAVHLSDEGQVAGPGPDSEEDGGEPPAGAVR